MLKSDDDSALCAAGQLLLDSDGLVPGRALGPILDETHGEGRRRNRDRVRAIERRDSETRGGWRNRAQAERGTGAAGRVWFFASLGVRRTGIDRGVIRLASVLVARMRMRIGHVLVGLRTGNN